MSQPRDPYGRPYQPHQQQPPYGQQPYPRQQPYQPEQPYRQQPYQPQQPYQREQGRAGAQRPPAPPASPQRPGVRLPRRIPGLGLILTGVSLVIQVLSLTVLPFVRLGANEPGTASVPTLWHAATEFGTHGFGEWYLVLFSYPLAALGIVLALAAVLDSVALKVIWAGLAIVGLGYLVLRYGLGPFVGFGTNSGLNFTRQEITTAVVAAGALVVVIFVLKTALSMFRRVAGLILLGFAGLHIAAVVDLAKGSAAPGIGAYGPAVGYVLIAVAAFIGPRRLPGV